jgi:hypothetical protein
VKKIASVLSGSMARPDWWSQSQHSRYAERRRVVTSEKVAPQAKRLPSSTYMERLVFCQWRARWRMGEAKMIDKTGEMGEPWGVPTLRS